MLAECLSIREGLLDACGEIEQAMSDMQRRLGGLELVAEPEESESPVRGGQAPASNGRVRASNGRAPVSSSNGAPGR